MSVTDLAKAGHERRIARMRLLVKAGEQSAWEVGDLLLEELPMGKPGVATGVAAELRVIAAEVDGEPATLAMYRKVAHGWPNGTRVPFASWAAHRAYMGPPETALARAHSLKSLPRDEHGRVTKQAVRDMTAAASGLAPGWRELLGRVGDTIEKGHAQLDRYGLATEGSIASAALRENAARYAERADALAARLRAVAGE